MSTLSERARDYAINAHARINQLRKYTFQPYDVHLKAVADLVAMVTDDHEVIAAAWLHDTVEDTPATFEDIEREFGHGVSRLVMDMTDISRPADGNRLIRKEIDRDHTALASPRAKTIKLADLIDNCQDICRHDPHFGTRFLREMVDLLTVLHEGDQRLYRKALRTVEQSAKKLRIEVPQPTEGFVTSGETPPKNPYLQLAGDHGIRLFTTAFSARDILEALPAYDSRMIRSSFLRELAVHTAGAVGVREKGRIGRYMLDDDIRSGKIAVRTIEKQQQVSLDAPLATVIHILTRFSCCFVTINAEPVGVITRRDIEKPVVRMWLFGIIILVEMLLTKDIRCRWKDEDWMGFLSEGRVEKTRELQSLREKQGLKADLLDCLQFSDKLQIALNEPDFQEATGFLSNKAARRAIKDLEALRNNLAHGQDITSQDWPPIARLAKRVQEML
jgi:hypothetical protein